MFDTKTTPLDNHVDVVWEEYYPYSSQPSPHMVIQRHHQTRRPGDRIIVGLSPRAALNLLAWLQQEKERLEKLVMQQQTHMADTQEEEKHD